MQFLYFGDILFYESRNSKTLEYNVDVVRNVMDSNTNKEIEIFIKTIPNMRIMTIARMDDDEFNNFLKTNNIE